MDIFVRIDAKWTPREDMDADITATIVEISYGGGGDVCIDVCDTTIWISHSELLAALKVIYPESA